MNNIENTNRINTNGNKKFKELTNCVNKTSFYSIVDDVLTTEKANKSYNLEPEKSTSDIDLLKEWFKEIVGIDGEITLNTNNDGAYTFFIVTFGKFIYLVKMLDENELYNSILGAKLKLSPSIYDCKLTQFPLRVAHSLHTLGAMKVFSSPKKYMMYAWGAPKIMAIYKYEKLIPLTDLQERNNLNTVKLKSALKDLKERSTPYGEHSNRGPGNTLIKIHDGMYKAFYGDMGSFEFIKKKGGSKNIKSTKKVRKHQGIYQRGSEKGKLKPGYKYSGKKTKTGLKIIQKRI